MKTQPGGDIDKDPAGQKWQRTGQSNRSPFGTLTPDFGIGVAPMNPIAGEEPVSERRDDTGANNDRKESRPVHTVFLPNTQALYSTKAFFNWRHILVAPITVHSTMTYRPVVVRRVLDWFRTNGRNPETIQERGPRKMNLC